MSETKLIKIDEKLKIQSQNDLNINPRDFLLQFLKDFKLYDQKDFLNFLKENKNEVLIDIIWLLSLEQQQKEDSEKKSEISELTRLLIDNRIISKEEIIENLEDYSLIQETTDIPKETIISKEKKQRGQKYQILKYNLLREESEGYSKLIIDLLSSNSIEFHKIQSLIAQFDLEPNRVLDIILECFESRLDQKETFLKLIDNVDLKKNIPSLMGFKFNFYTKNKKKTLNSLFELTAILIKNGDLSIESIYESLSEEEIDHQNQKIQLVEYLFQLDCWEEGMKLYKILLNYTTLQPYLNQNISTKICEKISDEIKEMYQKISASILKEEELKEYKFQKNDEEKLTNEIFPILLLLKSGISFDVVLFTKIIRILQVYYSNHELNETHLLESLISGLCYLETNTGLVYEFWDLMKIFHFSKRFQIYGSIKNLKIYQTMQTKVSQSLKRLAKENTKSKAREIAKMAHTNPLSTCEKVLYYAESFDNQIPILVDVLRYTSNLFHDMITYSMLNKLSNDKSRLKKDGVSIANWLSNLTLFTGLYLKKYFAGDISPFIIFIKKRLMSGNWEDLIILKEIIKQICSIEIIEEIQISQIEAQSGGDTLKSCGGSFGDYLGKSNKKSTRKLRETLDEESILFFISKFDCSLLNLHDEEEMSNSLIRLVSDSQDKSHEVLLMLLRFYEEQIARSTTPLTTLKQLPSLNELLITFEISIENSFSLIRTLNTKEENEKIELKEIKPLSELWSYFSPEFYKFFWISSSYDIFVPHHRYLEEVGTYQKLVDTTPTNEKERRESKKKKELFELTIKELNKERSDQVKNASKFISTFKEFKSKYFTKDFDTWKFLQYCIYPRCIFSGLDSFYCSKFIELLILYEVENFDFFEFFSLIISNAPNFIYSLTANEVYRFSFFLKYLLNLLGEFYDDKKIYEKRRKIFRDKISSHEEFKSYFEKINQQFLSGIMKLLKGENFNARNTLMILTNLGEAKLFPKFYLHGMELKKVINTMKSHVDKNIQVLCERYHPLVQNLTSKLKSSHEEQKKKKNETKKEIKTKSKSTYTSVSSKRSESSIIDDSQKRKRSDDSSEDRSTKKLKVENGGGSTTPERKESDDIQKRRAEKFKTTSSEPTKDQKSSQSGSRIKLKEDEKKEEEKKEESRPARKLKLNRGGERS
eukprot:gene11236-4056_t